MADQARHDKGAKQPYQTKPILSSKLVTFTGMTILCNPAEIPAFAGMTKKIYGMTGNYPVRFASTPSHSEGDYFFTAQNRASSHPMPVHPNTHDAMRMRMTSALALSFFAARYAGASIIAHSASPATVYLIIKMCSGLSAIFYFPYVALLPNSSSIRNN